MKNTEYKTKSFLKSQGHAREGVRLIFKNERNFRIDIVFAIIIFFVSFLLKISHQDWIAICLVISMVLISESINSAIEALCDTVSSEYNMNIKYAKDVSAGAVLVSALVSVVTGVIVLLPYLIEIAKNLLS